MFTYIHMYIYSTDIVSFFSFKCNPETASVVLKLRNSLRRLLIKKALYPSPIEEDSFENKLIKYVGALLCLILSFNYGFFLNLNRAIEMLISIDDSIDDDYDYMNSEEICD